MIPHTPRFRNTKLSFIFLMVGFFYSSLILFSPGAWAANFVSVAKDGVNLRSGPDVKYEILYELPEGYPLKVLEKKSGWLMVSDYQNDRGWIYSSLVSNDRYVIVKVTDGNVRSGPGTNYNIIGQVYKDVILKKISSQNKWVKVAHPQLPGGSGWVYQSLIWP